MTLAAVVDGAKWENTFNSSFSLHASTFFIHLSKKETKKIFYVIFTFTQQLTYSLSMPKSLTKIFFLWQKNAVKDENRESKEKNTFLMWYVSVMMHHFILLVVLVSLTSASGLVRVWTVAEHKDSSNKTIASASVRELLWTSYASFSSYHET